MKYQPSAKREQRTAITEVSLLLDLDRDWPRGLS